MPHSLEVADALCFLFFDFLFYKLTTDRCGVQNATHQPWAYARHQLLATSASRVIAKTVGPLPLIIAFSAPAKIKFSLQLQQFPDHGKGYTFQLLPMSSGSLF